MKIYWKILLILIWSAQSLGMEIKCSASEYTQSAYLPLATIKKVDLEANKIELDTGDFVLNLQELISCNNEIMPNSNLLKIGNKIRYLAEINQNNKIITKIIVVEGTIDES